MTVKELKEILNKYPEDQPVKLGILDDGEGDPELRSTRRFHDIHSVVQRGIGVSIDL